MVKSILVLGAGATLAEAEAAGVTEDKMPPLDRNFFDIVRRRNSSDPDLSTVEHYLKGTFEITLRPGVWDSIESVFALVVTECELARRRKGTRSVAAFRAMLNLYRNVIDERCRFDLDSGKSYVGQWITQEINAGTKQGDLAIITFNHDLVAERILQDSGHLEIPGCYAISKFNGQPAAGEGRRPRLKSTGQNGPVRILKLHGSLNWLSLHTSSAPRYTELKNPKNLRWTNLKKIPLTVAEGGGTKVSKTAYPLVIPPVRNKSAMMPEPIRTLRTTAVRELRTAQDVTFFGYSCPIADTESESLFRSTLGQSRYLERITVVNTDPATLGRFGDFVPGRNLQYFPNAHDWINAFTPLP